MEPIEKLRADIVYWQQQNEKARESLRVGELVLNSLLDNLAMLEPTAVGSSQVGFGPESVKAGTDIGDLRVPERDQFPQLSGDATAQVEQALIFKSPQSTEELMRTLAEYGIPFSRGAVGFALRNLRDRGRIYQTHKLGNLAYFAPVNSKDSLEGEER